MTKRPSRFEKAKYACVIIALFFASCTSNPKQDAPKISNPFKLDIPQKDTLTAEDYQTIQNQLRTVDIVPILEQLYNPNGGYTYFNDFKWRCTRGLRQTLINEEEGHFPAQNLEKIGEGGDMCFITCVPFDGVYPSLIESITNALKESGFNGYFLYQMGGFPNPTGKEIQFVGVPYSFKIFLMMEAQKRGFNKVIWIDSAALPLRDPTPLFDVLDKKGALIHGWKSRKDDWKYIFPATRQLLLDLTGTDVLQTRYVNTIIFGLKLDTPEAKKFIEEYYKMVEMGTPFLSCFPEEFVITAITGQKEFAGWKTFGDKKLMKGTKRNQETAVAEKKAQEAGYYFYHRKH